jgi:alcohol dehydrogenase
MIAQALGAQVIAVDINDDALKLALSIGASVTINAEEVSNVAQAIKDASNGGAHLSIDALGSTTTCLNSIGCLRKRGRHVQVGLMVDEHQAPPIPMGQVIANELEILGSHGMQSYKYEGMLNMIISGKLNPKRLISRTVSLKDSLQVLVTMGNFSNSGVTVIDKFDVE